ncbi:MAG: S8 family serine peptidase [Flavobacteriaceae bacterium]|nr:S8 family serine peptidase [Flavobacteriaceae bacterium]
MKRNSLKALLALGAIALVVSCTNDSISEESEALSAGDFNILEVPEKVLIPNQYVVIFNEDKLPVNPKLVLSYKESQQSVRSFAEALFNQKNLTGVEINRVYSKSITGVSIKIAKEQIAAIRNDDKISVIEQDWIYPFAPPCGTPNGGPCDPDNGDGGNDGGNDTGGSTQQTPWGITRVNGVSNYTGTGVAYVLDSGIDLTHPDLNVNASLGFNAFTSGADSKNLSDGNGHGTHVAGTIAAINNNEGVIGVAPGATVVPVKVLDRRGSGSLSGVIAGIDFVAANGSNGDVANMSLGGGASSALDLAVFNAAQSGVKFVLAAGNNGANANNFSPARVNGPNIFTISAMSTGDNWASFSNFANPPVDFCAPGVSILSTWKGGGYNTISGTSMAAPHAAGILLLGNPSTDGVVNNDPDGTPDPIIVH